MITAIVTFPPIAGASVEDMAKTFASTAPLYTDVPGLLRKSYIFDPETGTAGGVYTLESRAAAEALFDDAWRQRVTEKYGGAPDLRIFASPVGVWDGEVHIGDAA